MNDRKVFNIIFDWVDGKLKATVIQIGSTNILMNSLSADQANELLAKLVKTIGGENE